MHVPPKSILFITGTFFSNDCWDQWQLFFRERGFTCLAPAWPFKNASSEDLRNRPRVDGIASNTLAGLTDYFASFIKMLPERPILVGHSLGGLIVQLLLYRGYGAGGVAIHSFPAWGIRCFRFSFLKVFWKALAVFSRTKTTYLMSFSSWRLLVANGLDYEQQKESYYMLAIPESKKIIRDAFATVARVDFSKPHPPLLFTSGTNDRLIPAELNYCNYKKYLASGSVTDYKVFRGHNHLVFEAPAFRREAESILHWLGEIS